MTLEGFLRRLEAATRPNGKGWYSAKCPAHCNTDGGVGFNTVQTESRASCVSTDLASDMVGNLSEWVVDWVPPTSASGAPADLVRDGPEGEAARVAISAAAQPAGNAASESPMSGQ